MSPKSITHVFDEIPLDEASFVVVDVETTGMNALEDRITEIAMLKVRGGQLVEEFSTLVNPLITIPAYITDLTGIDNIMVQDAPPAREVAPFVAEFLKGSVFAAHNAPFDWGFVAHTVHRESGLSLNNPQLCTVKLSRRILPALPSKSLGPVTHHLNITIPQRHRASGDAFATALVLVKFLSYLKKTFAFRTVGEVLRFQTSPVRRHQSV
jgi:DNA polymerase III subunit epsilon